MGNNYREYNEDPIIKSLLPPTWLNARRRTILVFTLDESSNKVNMAAITRYSFGSLIESVWDKEKEPDQMKALVDYLKLKNPKKLVLTYRIPTVLLMDCL